MSSRRNSRSIESVIRQLMADAGFIRETCTPQAFSVSDYPHVRAGGVGYVWVDYSSSGASGGGFGNGYDTPLGGHGVGIPLGTAKGQDPW